MPIIEGCGSHGGHFQRNRLEHPAGKAAWRFMPKMVIAVPPGRRCGYAREQEARLKIQLLCDGAPEMWNLLEEGFIREKFGKDLYRLVDLHHLTEKLGGAARVIDGGP